MLENINIHEIEILFFKLIPYFIILLILFFFPYILHILNNIKISKKNGIDKELKQLLKKHRDANLEKKSAIFVKEIGNEKINNNQFIFFNQYKYKVDKNAPNFIEKNIFKKLNNKWILTETKEYNYPEKKQKHNSFKEWALKNWPSK